MNIGMTHENVIDDISMLKLPKKGYRDLLGKDVPYKIVKRTADVTLSSIAMVALLPVFAVIALAIKLESKGPVFFKHTRIGKDGKIIKLYKFRRHESKKNLISKEKTLISLRFSFLFKIKLDLQSKQNDLFLPLI